MNSFFLSLILVAASFTRNDVPSGVLIQQDTIEASIIFPKGALMRFIKASAEDFEQRTPRNSVCKITFTKTVSANGRYREFVGYKGLQTITNWTNRPKLSRLNQISDVSLHYSWYPLSLMRSRSWDGEQDEVLEQQSLYENVKGSYATKSNICYNNGLAAHELLEVLRSVEVLTPLNSKRMKDFDYYVNSLNDDGSIRTVTFSTKNGVFPDKSRLYGTGKMSFSGDGHIKEIVLNDFLDFWSKYSYATPKSIPKTATRHSCRLTYQYINDRYYLKDIEVTCEWDKSMRDGSYALLSNPRRHPYKVNLIEVLHLQCSEPREIDQEYVAHNAQGVETLYAPFKMEEWKEFPRWIAYEKIVSDLSIDGKSFASQCEIPTRLDEYISCLGEDGKPIAYDARISIEKRMTETYQALYQYAYGTR